MNTHANKTQENKSRSVANSVALKKSNSESTFQLVDKRPEAIAQRKLQETANNSPQFSKLRAFQEMANNSSQAKHAAQLHPLQRLEPNTNTIQRMPNPATHIGNDIVNVTFGMNHPVSDSEFSLYHAEKKAKKRGQKNTIIKISNPELHSELKHTIGKVTPEEFSNGNNIEKETTSKYEWITSNENGSAQKGGNQKITVGLNTRNGQMSNQMWIAHLAHKTLLGDDEWLEKHKLEHRV
jgi:hypothetical protein